MRAEAPPDLERARQGGAGLGFGRESVLVLEDPIANAVVREAQGTRQPDRARADDRNRKRHGRTGSFGR